MSYHHPFSPSSLGRRRLCPGSFLMEQKVKNPEASEYAVEGTMLHELIATRIEGRSWDRSKLNADQLNTLENAYEWFKYEILTPLTESVGPQVWKWVQTEENLGYWDGDDELLKSVISGTVDVLVDTRDGYAVIVDWKFGRAEVSDVSSTMQLAGYAILAFEAREHIQAIDAYIYQPRTGTIQKARFDRDDLAEYQKAIKETIAACLLKDPPLAASWDACAYCSAISICPEAENKAAEFSQDQAIIERPLFNIEKMDADTLGQMLDDTKVAEKFLKEVKAKCKEVMIDGQEATGWAIGERSGMKAIDDTVALAITVDSYLSLADILSVSSLSGVDFTRLTDIVDSYEKVNLLVLLPHAKISVPKLITKLTDKIIEKWEAEEGPDPLTMPKTEARRRAYELIESHIIEGPKINALNRRKD